MMRPQPRSTMPSITWRVTLKTLSRLVESTARHCSSVILRKVESRVMPAQLMRMSTGPCSASIFFTIAPMASKSVTSPKASALEVPFRPAAAIDLFHFSSLPAMA